MYAAPVPALQPVWWDDAGLGYVDQRALPDELVRVRASDVAAVIDALESGAVRGARCSELFRVFGAVLARTASSAPREDAYERLRLANSSRSPGEDAIERVLNAPPGAELATAREILDHARNVDWAIIRHATQLLPAIGIVMTHGSSGAFSTGAHGTALGAIIAAHRSGKRLDVYIGEAQPQASGRRLAAFECAAAGVPCAVFPDGAAASLLRDESIAAVIVGAEAMAANGDILAETGTYALALAAAQHGVPFYVALPRAAVHASVRTGDLLGPAHENAPRLRANGDPARLRRSFVTDRTPGRLIGAVATEYGISRPPYDESLAVLATRPRFVLTLERA